MQEAKVEATTGDYLLSEMMLMAIDFEEETYAKRVLQIRLAKEAALKLCK